MKKQIAKNTRQYHIDWIRICLILSVFLFHIGMVFNGWNWHIKNDDPQQWLHPIMEFLHAWRMPLLFLVSGVGTRFALGKRTITAFAYERIRRLLLPFISGLFILVPIQVYFEKIEDYHSLWHFYQHMFDGIYPEGNFSWHHLWFILYLFIISMLFVPFLRFYRSKHYPIFENQIINFCRIPGTTLLFVIPILIVHLTLLPYFPHETHALFNDWAYFAVFLFYFIYGFVLIANHRILAFIARDRKISLGMAIIFTFVMFHLRHWFPQINSSFLYHLSAIVMGWSLGLTILGYSRRKINADHRWRKPLNQAIYPIYLLHQPLIVISAYYVIGLSVPTGIKAVIILLASATSTFVIYRYLILPFNMMRLIFGLRLKTTNRKKRCK